jgi:hypothetical protein
MRTKKAVGGNSGYIGYSMSKRANEARNEGKYPRTDFKKEYNITEASVKWLIKIGAIKNSEWHHTSMYGNKTTFLSWEYDLNDNDEEISYYGIYEGNKKEIDKVCRKLENAYNASSAVWHNPEKEERKVYEKVATEAAEILNSIFSETELISGIRFF